MKNSTHPIWLKFLLFYYYFFSTKVKFFHLVVIRKAHPTYDFLLQIFDNFIIKISTYNIFLELHKNYKINSEFFEKHFFGTT